MIAISEPNARLEDGWLIDGVYHGWDCACGACAIRSEMLDEAERVVEWWQENDHQFLLDEREAEAWLRDNPGVSLTDEWAEAQEEAARRERLDGEPLSAFKVSMAEVDASPPTALLCRSDGAPLLYDGHVNLIYGLPSCGKTWVALHIVGECLLRGMRVAYLDYENGPGSIKGRMADLGFDALEYEEAEMFMYIRPVLQESALAMAEAMEWLTQSDGPGLVVIDSLGTAGCPADGSDVKPWIDKHLMPFKNGGASVVGLDHIPKRVEGRPRGPIGSQYKLQVVDGAALLIQVDKQWNKVQDGRITLRNEKNRFGALPAAPPELVAAVTAKHVNDSLDIAIVPPDQEDALESAYLPTLKALLAHGCGVVGKTAMRRLVKGTTDKRDTVIKELVREGYIAKGDKVGRKETYLLTQEGQEFIDYDSA